MSLLAMKFCVNFHICVEIHIVNVSKCGKTVQHHDTVLWKRFVRHVSRKQMKLQKKGLCPLSQDFTKQNPTSCFLYNQIIRGHL